MWNVDKDTVPANVTNDEGLSWLAYSPKELAGYLNKLEAENQRLRDGAYKALTMHRQGRCTAALYELEQALRECE